MSSIFKACTHPFVSFFYFSVCVSLSIAVKNPCFTASSFLCALLMNLLLCNWSGIKNTAVLMPVFIFLSCLNPLVSRWGETVLFYLFSDKSKPFTLEAFCYGLNTAFMLVTIVLWFLAFNKAVTGEKLTFIFGRFFPSVSLMLVMILRMIPFYRRRSSDITDGRRGLGLEKDSSFSAKFREKMHVLSAVTASTLEDGHLTAQSMEMRGWGKAKRTSFIHYRFTFFDFFFLAAGVSLTVFSIVSICKGGGAVSFYPVINIPSFRGNFWNTAAFTSNTLLTVICAIKCKK